MTRREKHVREYCLKAHCHACAVVDHYARKGKTVKRVSLVKSVHTNVGVAECELENGEVFYFSIPACQLSIMHFYGLESYGATMLGKVHGIFTIDKIVSKSRTEILGLGEVGPQTIAKLDSILISLGWWYKEEAQGELFPADLPPLEM